MYSYYISFQTMISAQKAAMYLQNRGYGAEFLRAPKVTSQTGCSYAVKTGHPEIGHVLSELRTVGLIPGKVFRIDSVGRTKEVFV